ncbi:MAG TPA: transcription antitermination factor NusB [Caldithrix abyssi]|uniref:Transcription antitermination protein NusB n=1 Tax=Caldithrix abyssi TaxID=187145 RepID=A0A7V5PQ86_CALAY|nr:transcription antitermination factor NusB [Caldithrix abyssi]
MTMKRRKEREFALQILFALEFNPEAQWIELVERLDEKRKKYNTPFARELIKNCVTHLDEIDAYIKQQLLNWDYNRVAVVDKVLLRMAVAEFLFFETVPPEASINEAIEISKEYSTERSGKFINGILDAILKKLKSEGKLRKTGRGALSHPQKEK